MAESKKIILPHGGYKGLIVYHKSETIYQGTVLFCKRFFPAHGDRTVDQMVQAARSCKQNIVEGSAASGTSKETEIKLTNVAKATLDELMEDYRDCLKRNHLCEWSKDQPEWEAARTYAAKHNDWEDWQHYFETRNMASCANLMLIICHQTRYLLDKMLGYQEDDFKKHGGIRERMHAVRTEARGQQWHVAIQSRLQGAETPEALRQYAEEMIQQIHRECHAIRKRKGW
jgi:four helix bundle suffix protein